MSPAQRRLWNRLQRQAATLEPEIARAMRAAYDAVKDLLPEAELARLIDSGAFQMLATTEALGDASLDRALAPLRSVLQQSVTQSMAYFGKDIAAGISFDYLNPRIVDAIRALDTKAVQTIRESIRESVRTQVQAGIEAGTNPRTIARGIRQSLGLSEQQTQWVANFRAELEAGSRAALNRVLQRGGFYNAQGEWQANAGHAGGKGLPLRDMRLLNRKLGKEPLTPEQIDRMVTAYRDRLAEWNSETIARTLARQAQSKGQELAYRDAIQNGWVDGDVLFERWVGVDDGRERPEHVARNNQVVRFGEDWDGIRPAEEFNCRCLSQVFADRRRAEAA